MYPQTHKTVISLLLFCFILSHDMIYLQRGIVKATLYKTSIKPTNIFAGVDSHCSRLVSQCHINNDRRILHRP